MAAKEGPAERRNSHGEVPKAAINRCRDDTYLCAWGGTRITKTTGELIMVATALCVGRQDGLVSVQKNEMNAGGLVVAGPYWVHEELRSKITEYCPYTAMTKQEVKCWRWD